MSQTKAIRRFNPEDTSRPTVWILKECPFAEKACIGLYEMGVEFDVIHVDLSNKPASLFEVNKKGLVPAMKDQGNAICDSAIILEYIEDMWTRPDKGGLLPEAPALRATARTWSSYINSNIVKLFYELLLKQNQEERDAAKTKLLDVMKTLEEVMRSISDGPFFMGKEFGLVDIMLAPHVERFPVLEHYRGFTIPDTEDFKRFHLWWKTVQEVPSFQRAKINPDIMISGYKKYADNMATSQLSKAINKGEAVP